MQGVIAPQSVQGIVFSSARQDVVAAVASENRHYQFL